MEAQGNGHTQVLWPKLQELTLELFEVWTPRKEDKRPLRKLKSWVRARRANGLGPTTVIIRADTYFREEMDAWYHTDYNWVEWGVTLVFDITTTHKYYGTYLVDVRPDTFRDADRYALYIHEAPYVCNLSSTCKYHRKCKFLKIRKNHWSE